MRSNEQAPRGRIDAILDARRKRLGLPEVPPCSDETFLRRAGLDLAGTLPTAQEAAAFLADKRPDRRARWVQTLLDREEHAEYMALKWSDLLRVKSEFPINLWPLAAHAYHRWIRTALRQNWPFDRFARALLTSTGSNFRDPQVNFYRAVPSKDPASLAKAVALTFMGERAEKWPAHRLAGMSAFFSQVRFKSTGEWKEEIVLHDPSKPLTPAKATFPDGTPARLTPGSDPRKEFSIWLTAPENPWFAKNLVNRVWHWLMGTGIVHEPDDVRPDNPPKSPELLAYLENELVASKYDVKHIFRLIAGSAAYQSSTQGPAAKETERFAQYRIRRLDAEVLIDAINQITGTSESYSSITPEPFTFIPESNRSIALADGSITSGFLEMFGRPPRDTGLESERMARSTAAQRLHMLNSSHIQRKIERGPKIAALLASAKNNPELIDAIFLTVLTRLPRDPEKQVATAYLSRAATRDQGAHDLIWAALNSSEFLHRH